ncbi:MAG TPA: NUDIX domain-containing protein, partial [Solirubrobacterales bacterium]|nr:NUDIX domain-containing protein [Solirubrobacterales bacterium]
ALAVLRRGDGRVLMILRGDDGTWGLPAGHCEEDQSFLETARTEVSEEVDLRVAADDFVAFGSLSGDAHVLSYANGDVSQAYSLCFLAERWEGEPRPDGSEVTDLRWADPSDPPAPTHTASAAVLGLLAAYEQSGRFQAA